MVKNNMKNIKMTKIIILCIIHNKYNVCIKVIYFIFLFEIFLTRFEKCMKILLIRTQLCTVLEDRKTLDS